MQIKTVDVDTLTTDPNNARTHDARNLQAIQGSLDQFGQVEPLVVQASTGKVIGGNGRLEVMRNQGKHTVEVVEVDVDDQQAAALGLALNRTAELADWDTATLAELTDSLEDMDLDSLGFNAAEIGELLDEPPKEPEALEEPEAMEPPTDPITQPGDLWLLGGHRLLCGDCRKSEDVDRLMDGGSLNIAFTSPPYASQRKYDESSGFKPIRPDDYVDWFDGVQANVRRYLAGDGSWFVNIKEHCDDGQRSLYVKDLTLAHVRDWGWRFVDEFCWTRQGVPGGWPNRFKNAWEPILHFSAESRIKFNPEDVGKESGAVFSYDPMTPKGRESGLISGTAKNRKGARDGIARPSNVVKVSTGETPIASQHGATFPIGLPEFFIKAFSDKGDHVFDPFLGSGTTLIAAHQLERTCYGMEISPAYCDIIVNRWETLTGDSAVVGTGG